MTIGVKEYYNHRGYTLYIDVEVWDRNGERCMHFLKKGSPVFIAGTLKFGERRDRNGRKINTFYIYANTVRFLAKWYVPKPECSEPGAEAMDEELDGGVSEFVGDWSPVAPDSPTNPISIGVKDDDEFPF